MIDLAPAKLEQVRAHAAARQRFLETYLHRSAPLWAPSPRPRAEVAAAAAAASAGGGRRGRRDVGSCQSHGCLRLQRRWAPEIKMLAAAVQECGLAALARSLARAPPLESIRRRVRPSPRASRVGPSARSHVRRPRPMRALAHCQLLLESASFGPPIHSVTTSHARRGESRRSLAAATAMRVPPQPVGRSVCLSACLAGRPTAHNHTLAKRNNDGADDDYRRGASKIHESCAQFSCSPAALWPLVRVLVWPRCAASAAWPTQSN